MTTIAARAETCNLLIEQGQPFSLRIRFKADDGSYIDLLPYRFQSQIRKNAGLSSGLIATNTCTVLPSDTTVLVVESANTEAIPSNCSIEKIPENFERMPRSELPQGLFYWSVRAFVGGRAVSRPIEGSVIVTPETTSFSGL